MIIRAILEDYETEYGDHRRRVKILDMDLIENQILEFMKSCNDNTQWNFEIEIQPNY